MCERRKSTNRHKFWGSSVYIDLYLRDVQGRGAKALLMSTHNICFCGEIRKISAFFWWKKRLICCYGLIFLSISCLSMKMTLRNLCIELRSKMKHGSITDPKARKQSKQWKHPGSHPPNKFKRVSWAGKVITFGKVRALFMVDYFEENCLINGAYCAELRWLHQEIVKKRRGKLTWGVLLLQSNAPAQTGTVAQW